MSFSRCLKPISWSETGRQSLIIYRVINCLGTSLGYAPEVVSVVQPKRPLPNERTENVFDFTVRGDCIRLFVRVNSRVARRRWHSFCADEHRITPRSFTPAKTCATASAIAVVSVHHTLDVTVELTAIRRIAPSSGGGTANTSASRPEWTA